MKIYEVEYALTSSQSVPLHKKRVNESELHLFTTTAPHLASVRPVPWPEVFDVHVLDEQGRITLIDVMGDDLSPLYNARLSTGNQTGVDEAKDDSLRTRLWKDKHTCYDAETEVLVHGCGFVPWPQVTPDMRLGVWSPKKGSLQYEKPKRLIDEKFSGPHMYRVDHGGVDLLVTPNHNMWVQLQELASELNEDELRGWKEPQLISAANLGHRTMVRYSKLAPYTNAPRTEKYSAARLRLYGFFVGDGSARDSYRNAITFNVRKQRKVDFLQEICIEEGLEFEQRPSKVCLVREPDIAQVCQMFYNEAGEKQIPLEFQYMNQEDSAAFLDGLRASDGSEKRGTWQFSTSVRAVAEAVQLIALHAGCAAHVHENAAGMWNVMFLSRMHSPVVNQGKRQTSWVPYTGRVYCAETSTGILVVRRNGKIVLSGNSPFESAVLCFELELPMACLRQIDRHRTVSVSEMKIEVYEEYDDFRLYTNRNEFSARYSEMPDKYYIPGTDRMCKKGTANKQGSGIPLAGPVQESCVEVIRQHSIAARDAYDRLIQTGVASETARWVLPQNQMTKIRLQATLLNWLKFLALRLKPDVQLETRLYAEAIAAAIEQTFPRCWKVFTEHTLKAATFSLSETATLERALDWEALAKMIPEREYLSICERLGHAT
jgi:thymidylate synthase (FAD)